MKRQARRAYLLWRADPHHGRLQYKHVGRIQPIDSVRIGLDWRALGLMERDTVYWFWIGSHAQYDALLKRV